MNGSALDIGGSRARLYDFEGGVVISSAELWLPQRLEEEPDLEWGRRRVAAIAHFVGQHREGGTLPTSCAGRKDEVRRSVTLSFYGSPLPGLVDTVEAVCGVRLGELYDDDVCAGWGHLASPRGALSQDSPNSLLLTAGTGLAECLWADGAFVPKGSYPRAAEFGLEEPLRAEAWRGGALPLAALQQLLERRRETVPIASLLLSGRFAAPELDWPNCLRDGTPLTAVDLEEAPALGALALASSFGKA